MNLQPLRVWPAIVLLVIMVASRVSLQLIEERSMPLFMMGFMLPAIAGGLIWIWWVAMSRASKAERCGGGLAIAVIGVVSILLLESSLKGFGAIMYVLPWGLGLFGLAAVLCSRMLSTRRTVIAVLAGLVGFGYWDLVRSDGYWGDFRAARSWRWEPTEEEQFLASIEDREPADIQISRLDLDPFLNPEWSEFRGPDRDSVVPDTVLVEDWNNSPPSEVWKIQVGPAWSSFAVAGDCIITQEQRGELEAICCYDANSGEVRWERSFESRFWEPIAGTGPRATPTVHNGRLYALGAQGLLTCLEPLSGEVCWQRDLREDAKREPPTWGFSASPLVYQDQVIVYAGGPDDLGILSYDTVTGDLRWSAAAGDHTYSSPQLANVHGEDQVLLVDNQGLVAVDPEQGKIAWKFDYPFNNYRVLQPVKVGDNSFLIGTGMGTGTTRVDVVKNGDDFEAEEAWESRGIKPDFNDYLFHDGYIYGFDTGIFACIDAETGDKMWKKGRYGNGQALLLPAGNQILVLSEEGELVLLRTNPEKLEELGRFQAIEGKTWNHPVLVGNKLFVRNGAWAARFDLALVASDTDASNVESEDDADEQDEAQTDENEAATRPAEQDATADDLTGEDPEDSADTDDTGDADDTGGPEQANEP